MTYEFKEGDRVLREVCSSLMQPESGVVVASYGSIYVGDIKSRIWDKKSRIWVKLDSNGDLIHELESNLKLVEPSTLPTNSLAEE